jgi:hypothetical protein
VKREGEALGSEMNIDWLDSAGTRMSKKMLGWRILRQVMSQDVTPKVETVCVLDGQ